jgi:glycosyltransferase involved in cell wall biosynthesis
MDKLTLAIPSFNGAKYLESTLISLHEQRPFVRWWLQDAESSDASLRIANQYLTAEDCIVSEKDNGQTDALNRAFANMGGEIIGWLNSDDCLTPETAQTVVKAFAEHPDVDIIVGEVDWIDDKGKVTGHHKGQIETLEEMLQIYDFWWQQKQWVQPEVFFRRSLWEKAGPLNTDYNLAFDYAFWVSALDNGAKVLRIPKTFVQFRLHDEQKSTASRKAADEIRDIVSNYIARTKRGNRLHRKISRQLDYDRYQLGVGYKDVSMRPSLLRQMLKRPDFFLLKPVRRRVIRNLHKRILG